MPSVPKHALNLHLTAARALGIDTDVLFASYGIDPAVLDDPEARIDLARDHLGQSTLSFGEIAFLLGFSKPSTFHRAFRR